MKFAPIVPVKYHPAAVTNYHLILAHQVCNDKEYRDYYVSLPDSHTIILDNSVIELGKVDVALVKEALSVFRRAGKNLIIVAPDAISEACETLDLTKEFLTSMESVTRSHRLMVVPQGKTSSEWISCYQSLLEFRIPPDVVGIPRVTENFEDGGRKGLIQQIRKRNLWGRLEVRYHLLGIQHNIWEVAPLSRGSLINGCDSSLPLRAAYVHLPVRSVENLRELPDEPFDVDPSVVDVIQAIKDIQETLK